MISAQILEILKDTLKTTPPSKRRAMAERTVETLLALSEQYGYDEKEILDVRDYAATLGVPKKIFSDLLQKAKQAKK